MAEGPWFEKQSVVVTCCVAVFVALVFVAGQGMTSAGENGRKELGSEPEDGETVTVQFMSGGDILERELVVAASPETRRNGLSGMESIPAGGMLFVYPEESVQTFWMKDASIPLDMLFVSADGVIQTIHEADPEPGVPVDQLARYSSKVPVQYVIEVKQGFADSKGIQEGDRVGFGG